MRLTDATELTRASKEPIASLEKSIVMGWELLSLAEVPIKVYRGCLW